MRVDVWTSENLRSKMHFLGFENMTAEGDDQNHYLIAHIEDWRL